jgi:hypothetical protein
VLLRNWEQVLVLYHAPETTIGGANAIDFEKNSIVKNDSVFFKIPLKSVTPGTYEYVTRIA